MQGQCPEDMTREAAALGSRAATLSSRKGSGGATEGGVRATGQDQNRSAPPVASVRGGGEALGPGAASTIRRAAPERPRDPGPLGPPSTLMTGHWEASLKEWLVTVVLQEGGFSFEDHPPPGPSGIFLKRAQSLV